MIYIIYYIILLYKLLIDKSDIVILTDRGTAILPALDEEILEAFCKPCPKHLEGNLNTHGFFSNKILKSLYWEATSATTYQKHQSVLLKIHSEVKG
jgi:hypothetical protein